MSNGSANNLLKIVSIIDNTHLTVERCPDFTASSIGFSVPVSGQVAYFNNPSKILYLINSQAANSSFKFSTGSMVHGIVSGASANVTSIDAYRVDTFIPHFSINSPSSSTYNITYQLANSSLNLSTATNNLDLQVTNKSTQLSYIMSRSQEVVGTNLYGTRGKSAHATVTLSTNVDTTNLFSVPYVNGEELDFYASQYDVNDTSVNAQTIDTEVYKNGSGRSKYISNKVTLASGQYAEDIVVYLTGYRPAGSQINVYARVYNSADPDSFDDKEWSPLEIKNNTLVYSASGNEGDLVEYTYGFPENPEILSTTAVPSPYPVILEIDPTRVSQIVNTSIDVTAAAPAGTLIKLSDPMFAMNHEEFMVIGANSSTITLDRPVTNLNIPLQPQMDVLKYPTVAFNNVSNSNKLELGSIYNLY